MVPFLARFRNGYERATVPLGRACLRLGLTPDALTLISLVFGAFAGFVIARGAFLWGVVLMLLMGIADVLDGATARASDGGTPFGTVLDHTVDRYAEFFILLGVALCGVIAAGWAMFALTGMIMASYVRARAESTGLVASCNVGFAGRQEKLVVLGAGLVAQQLFPELGALFWAVVAVGVFSHLTALQRLLFTRRAILGDRARRLRKRERTAT
jgi:phosphatidylglycerophosphate synthase